MRKLTKGHLRKLIIEEFDLLLEAEPEDEEATDEGGDEEEGAAEEEGAEAETEEEDEVYVSPEEEASLSRSADDQILAHLIDFETKAMKTAKVAQDDTLRPAPEVEIELEWYKKSLGSVLFEEAEEEAGAVTAREATWVGSPDIDVDMFSADVSRLIDNYDSLLDMEALIINKATDYLLDKYDQETADYFVELLSTKHDHSAEPQTVDDRDPYPPAPQAVGSMAGEGGA